jgi:hypothetical protein
MQVRLASRNHYRLDKIMQNETPKTVKSSHPQKSFSQYLIESNFKLLIFFGKSMQFFGMRPVIGFLLGVAALYGYALYKPLPFIVDTLEAEPILLQGKVRTLEEQPLESFEIGILASRHGPFENGSFSIRVPHKQKYDILVWTPGYKVFKTYGDRNVVNEGGNNYSLKENLPAFPANLGIVQGTVKDQDERSIEGYVKIAEQIVKIDSNGNYRLKEIPLGQLKIRVFEDVAGKLLYEDDINVQLRDPTPKDITIVKESR